jgi:5'-phosphate synthase pdxT subunit
VLETLGARPLAVRRESELASVDGLVVPGGESTTMAKLARIFELLEPLRSRIAGGLPVFGTCAGMILLAREVLDGRADQRSFGAIDITVRRNAFGRQVDSFETSLEFAGLAERVHAVFIRAPWVEAVGDGVEVLSRVPDDAANGPAAGRIVAVRQGPLMATSFHPEVGGDGRVHRMFVDLVRQS